MKNMILIALFVLIQLLTGCKEDLSETLSNLKSTYQSNPTVGNAIALGEFYNNRYNRKLNETEDGIQWLKLALNDHPESLELKMLSGNLMTVEGGIYSDKQDYTKALQSVDEGFRIMDKTLAEDPDNPYLLIYHGINSATVPEMFNRSEAAVSDLNRILELGEDETGSELQIQALYHLALIYRERGDSQKVKSLEKKLKEAYPRYKEVINK